MDLSDAELQQRAEADRREVDPPIHVETPMWSKAGQLDWWVKQGQEWWGRVRGADAVNGGSEPLIFVPPNANDRDVWGMKPQRSGPPDDLLIVASSVRSSVRA